MRDRSTSLGRVAERRSNSRSPLPQGGRLMSYFAACAAPPALCFSKRFLKLRVQPV